MRWLKCVLSLAIILSLLFTFHRAANNSVNAQNILSKAVQATGASVQQVSVNGWSQLPLRDLTDEQMQSLVRQVMTGLNAGEYQATAKKSERYRMLRADAIHDRFHAAAIIQVLYPSVEGKAPEVYMVVNVESGAENGDAAAWQQKIGEIISNAGGSPRLTTCLIGWLDGKLEDGDRANRLHQAFKMINTETIDTLDNPEFSSYTGFTAVLPDYLEVGDKKMNINMAMRYSPYDNRTYVTVGSPVISREY